MYVFVMVA